MTAGVNIELFCCSGGLAEGFRRAGITFDFAIDVSREACDSYEANLGRRPAQMNARTLLEMVRAGWRPASVRLLTADPPCTPWSVAGMRKGLSDKRDMLLTTMALIEELRPARWLIANIPGLDGRTNWQRVVWPVIGERMARAGYCVDFARLDAADYGVPQRRTRPFWFGHRRDAGCIRWPARTHCDPNELRTPTLPGIASLRPWVTCAEALADLDPEDVGEPIVLWRGPGRRPQQSLLVHDRHPPSRPDKPAYTITARDRGGQGGSVMLWPWDRPATTVMCDPRIPPPGNHSAHPMSSGVRLSARARLVLQGFPSTWRVIASTKRARDAMIGQALPPPVAEAVARSILAHEREYD